jgi:hypothetical protein
MDHMDWRFLSETKAVANSTLALEFAIWAVAPVRVE